MTTPDLAEAAARALWLGHTTRCAARSDRKYQPQPEWYDELAAMPLSGPGFVEEWHGQAETALAAIEAAGFVVVPTTPASEIWREAVGGNYRFVNGMGVHTASHPATVKRVLESVAGTEAADVIVALVHRVMVGDNNAAHLRDALAELTVARPRGDETVLGGEL